VCDHDLVVSSTKRRGGNHKRRRKRYDNNDEDYLPETEKFSSYPPVRTARIADGVEYEDAALAAAMNLSLLGHGFPANYIQETEKATRKYRKQRKPPPAEYQEEMAVEQQEVTLPTTSNKEIDEMR